MTLAHLSDTHLGFRAFGRTTPSGFNQREADVMKTFKACLNSILERDPDLVVHSGDLFHVVRPSNATIVETFRTLTQFQMKRDGKPFVLIAGNHDSPRTSESGNILKLFEAIPGLHIQTGEATVIDLQEIDTEVLCVPSNSIESRERIEWTPQLGRTNSVLVIHGLAGAVMPEQAQFELADTRNEKWSYVALGDFHVHQKLGTNICYAGSTDYTSTNPWEEIEQPKVWVWFDKTSKELTTVPVETRKVIDLPIIQAADLTAEQIEEKMRTNANWDDEDLPIVRQRIYDLNPEIRGQLDMRLLEQLNKRALSYQLRIVAKSAKKAGGANEYSEAVSLERSWQDHVDAASLPGGVHKEDLKRTGLELLKEVEEVEADPVEA